MDLKDTFQKQQDILNKEPWASILKFVDRINEAHPDTLSCDLIAVNLRNGTAEIQIERLKTGAKIIIKSDLSPSSDHIKAQTPSNNTLFLPQTELSLSGFSISADGTIAYNVSEERPLQTIQDSLIPDLPSFLEPKPDWKKSALES